MKKKNAINRALAAKKLYIAPFFEVTGCGAAYGIMITSVGINGTNMPEEPASGSGSAPKRRTPVF